MKLVLNINKFFMDTALLSTIISAATSAASTGVGAGVSSAGRKKSQKRAYNYNVKLAQLQSQLNQEQSAWNYLNSAKLQKQGLKQAGISTALMNEGTATAGSMSNVNVPSMPGSYDTGELIGNAFGSLVQNIATLSQARLSDALAKKAGAETEGQEIKNELESRYGAQNYEASIKNLDEDTKFKVSQQLYNYQKSDNDTKLTNAQVKSLESEIKCRLSTLPLQVKLLSEQAFEANQSGKLKGAEVYKVYQDISESQARIKLIQSQTGMTDAQRDVLLQTVTNKIIEAGILAKDLKIKGNQVVSSHAQAQLDQLNRDIQQSMGLPFYQVKNVIGAVIPLMFAGSAVAGALKGGASGAANTLAPAAASKIVTPSDPAVQGVPFN